MGTWSLDVERPGGALTLIGVDELVADLDSWSADCMEYSIDGVDQPALCGE
jgi:hypothetical protein